MSDGTQPVAVPDPYRADAAPYVLGALSAAERAGFEEHLRGCDGCRAAVDDVAALPALLDLVPVEVIGRLTDGPDLDPEPLGRPGLHDAVPYRLVDDLAGRRPAEPPEHLLPNLRTAVRQDQRRRRRSRVLVLAAAAAVVVLLGVLPGLPWSADHVTTERVELSAVVDSPMVAEVSLRSQEWGTRIDLDCHYRESDGPDGATEPTGPYGSGSGSDAGTDGGTEATAYSLVVTDVDGRDEQVATWSAHPGTRMSIPAATSLPRDLIAGIELRGEGTALLQADLLEGQRP